MKNDLPLELLLDNRGAYGFVLRDSGVPPSLYVFGEHSRQYYLYLTRPDTVKKNYERTNVRLSCSRLFHHPFLGSKYDIETGIRRDFFWGRLEKHGLPRQRLQDWWSDDKAQQDKNRRLYFGLRKSSYAIFGKTLSVALSRIPGPHLKTLRRFVPTVRGPLYTAFCTEGEYARQLAETFPVLALILYDVCRPVEEMREPRAMVRRGMPLCYISRSIELPDVFKRAKPGAAHLLMSHLKFAPFSEVEGLQRLFRNYFPDTLPKQRLWLRAVSRAAGNPDYQRWIAKNLFQLGAPQQQVLCLIEDMKDWVSASRSSRHSNILVEADEFISNKVAEAEAVGAEMIVNHLRFARRSIGHGLGPELRLIMRPFTPEMAPQTAVMLSGEWHRDVSKLTYENGRKVAFPEPWYPGGGIDGYQVVPITTCADLFEEGNSMRHCVASYATNIEDGSTYVYSFRTKTDERVATFELIQNTFKNLPEIGLGQIRGHLNSRVPKDIEKTIRSWFRSSKKKLGLGKWVKPPTPDAFVGFSRGDDDDTDEITF